MHTSRVERLIQFGLAVVLLLPAAIAQPRTPREPRVDSFEAIRDEITDQVARQLDIGALALPDLKQAYIVGDPLLIQHLMGFTDAQAADLATRLKTLADAELRVHPEQALSTYLNPPCPACSQTNNDIAAAFAKLDLVLVQRRDRVVENRKPNADAAQPDGCRWVPYTAALALCTRFGPWGYWPCSLVAYCNFCYGPTHNQVCQVNQ
jgi:hypothetical protein